MIISGRVPITKTSPIPVGVPAFSYPDIQDFGAPADTDEIFLQRFSYQAAETNFDKIGVIEKRWFIDFFLRQIGF